MNLLSRFPSGGAEGAEEARRALRDRRRADDEERDEHRLTGQEAYEHRLAAAEAKRQAERDALHEAHLGREEQRWAQIAVLRGLRAEIAAEQHDLTARFYGAIERGALAEAIDAQQRLAVLGPIDGIACQRLAAHGIEVK